MNTERKLLAAAMDRREAFNAVDSHLDIKDLTEPGKLVMEQIGAYYERDPKAESVDVETLTGLVLQTVANPKHKETFTTIMGHLGETEVSGLNVAAELIGAKREALAHKLSTALAAGDTEKVDEMMDEYLHLEENSGVASGPEILNAPTIDELVGLQDFGDLIRMYPRSLDERLDGGLVRGHHVLLFARPEMGKTMFIVNLVRGFLHQGLKVLYCANEEPVTMTALRFIGRMTEKTQYQVLADRPAAEAAALEMGYANLYMVQLTPGTPREIEGLTSAIKPDVLIVDQIRHLNVKDDNFVRQLEKAAIGVRMIGLRHNCLVISVTQAGDSAHGKAVLELNDVDYSNTGMQGAVDVMIGLGATREDEEHGRRVISLPKNKRSGNHSFFPVRVDVPLNKLTPME